MSSNWSCSKILCYGHPCTSILQVASLPAVASLLSSKVPLQQRYQCKSCQLLDFCHWYLLSPPLSMFFQSRLPWTQMQTRTCIRCLWTWVEGDAALWSSPSLGPKKVLCKHALILTNCVERFCFWRNANAGCGFLLSITLWLGFEQHIFYVVACSWSCNLCNLSVPIVDIELDHMLVGNNVKIGKSQIQHQYLLYL